MSELTDATKLQTVIDALFLTSNKISKELGYKAPASIYHVLKGLNKLSPSMIDKIVQKYPQVNIDYLRTGSLPVLLSNEDLKLKNSKYNIPGPNSDAYKMFSQFAEIPQKLDRIIDLLEEKNN